MIRKQWYRRVGLSSDWEEVEVYDRSPLALFGQLMRPHEVYEDGYSNAYMYVYVADEGCGSDDPTG